MSVAKVAIQFTAIDLLSRGVDTMKKRMDSFKDAGVDAQRSFNRMTTAIKLASVSGILTKSIYNSIKPAISVAGDLQAELLGVNALLAGMGDKVGSVVNKFSATAFDIQAWTPFDITQIVALERQLTKSGASIDAVLSKTGVTAAASALAIQEGLDPVTAGKSLIRLATPFSLAADQYAHVADMISRAADVSPVGAAEIVETAKYAALPLAALGRTVDEVVTLSAVLAKSGIDASMAGTGLRQFFSQAAKVDAFKDANGDLIETSEIIEKLRTGFEGVGKADLMERLIRGFGLRGMPIALALMKKGEAGFKGTIDAMKRVNPLQEKMATRMRGFIAQLNSLKGTSKSLIAQLYQPALEPLTFLLKGTNDLLTSFGRLAQEKPSIAEFVSKFSLGTLFTGGAATAGLGLAALFFGKKAIKGMGGFKGVFKGLTSTLVGVVKGKALEAAAGIKPVFVTNWPVDRGINAAAAGLNEKLKGIKKGAEDGFGSLTAAGGGAAAAGGTGLFAWLGTKIGSFLPKAFLTKLAGMGKIGGALAALLGTAGTMTTLGVAGAGLGTGVLLGKLIDQNDFISDKLDKTVDLLYDISPDFGISDYFADIPDLVEATKRSDRMSRVEKPLAVIRPISTEIIKNTILEKILTKNNTEKFLNERTENNTEKFLNERTENNTEKFLNERTENNTEKFLNERTENNTEKFLNEKTENNIERFSKEKTENNIERILQNRVENNVSERVFREKTSHNISEKILREKHTTEKAERILRTEKTIGKSQERGEMTAIPTFKNDINLNVRIDERNRVITDSSDNTRIKTTLDRGGFSSL